METLKQIRAYLNGASPHTYKKLYYLQGKLNRGCESGAINAEDYLETLELLDCAILKVYRLAKAALLASFR